MFACLALIWYSGRRYFVLFQRAQTYAERSSCPACRTYGRFEIIASGNAVEASRLDAQEQALAYPWLRVRCRKCAAVWRMPD